MTAGDDIDGDGVADECDNCPLTANPGQEVSVNASGIGDACGCMANPSVVLPSCTQDSDCGMSNQLPNPCVQNWSGILGMHCAQLPDNDGDGVPDVCDNCVSIFNPDQADANNNGLGDLCDPCPCSPVGTEDPDGDLICNSCVQTLGQPSDFFCSIWCPAHPVDNCPADFNPSQNNCNVDWEAIHSQPLVGDACDATPCTYTSFTPAAKQKTCNPSGQSETFVRVAFNPEILPADKNPALAYPFPPTTAKLMATTGARFCFCSDTDPAACAKDTQFGCSLESGQYGAKNSIWVSSPTMQLSAAKNAFPTKPFTNPKVEFASLAMEDPTEPFDVTNPPSPVLQAQGDGTFLIDWDITPLKPITPPNAPADAAFVEGVFWSHVTFVNGLTQPSQDAAMFTPRANHYAKGSFGYPGSQCQIPGTPVVSCLWCPNTPIPDPTPGPQTSLDVGNLVTLLGDPGKPLQLGSVGKFGELNLTPWFTPGVLQQMQGLLASGSRFVSASETNAQRRPSAPVLAAVAADGSSVGMILAPIGGKSCASG